MDGRITPQRPGELRALLARFDAALLLTRREDDPLRLRGRPIRIAEVDASDQVWFFAPVDCDSLREALSHDAYLVWQTDELQVVIEGALDACRDRDRIASLWIDDEDLPVPGPSDPSACLVCMKPRAADIWQLARPSAASAAMRGGLSPSGEAAPRQPARSTLP